MSNSSKLSVTSTCRGPGRRAAAGLLAGLVLLASVAGCSNNEASVDASLDRAFKKLFEPRRTPQQYMVLAVSSEDADVRRDAVAKISESKLYDREWAVKGFIAIALLESEEQTRCVAIRALARTSDPRAFQTMLKILNHRDHPPEEVWPPTDLVRWDATLALAVLSEKDAILEEQRDAVQAALIERLRRDSNRHARIAAARGLGCYLDEAVIEALIAGLRDEDFTVAHECENSLVKLTGRTHNTDVLAWEEWFDEHRDRAFAHAGEIPPERQLPYDNRWEKSWWETKELVRWLWPGEKEE
jgi:hypothetical protein